MKNVLKIAVLAVGFTIAYLAARAFLRSAPSSVVSGPSAAVSGPVSSSSVSGAVPSSSASGPVRGFAVVELFTSEGCSSCPPADQLVARIQQEDKDQPVYILAFHVDYWNRLGWKDAFSDTRYTQRQSRYASWLNLQTVYTPQIVVNGRKEFVGSQENTLRSAIRSGLDQLPAAQVTLTGVRSDQGSISWHYQVQNSAANSSLIVALVQRSATTDVKAGENSGRTLAHVQIVRNFTSTPVGKAAEGNGTIQLPQGLAGGDEELIAFIQHDDNGQIDAATSAPIH